MPGEQEKQVRVHGTAMFERRGLAARSHKSKPNGKGQMSKGKSEWPLLPNFSRTWQARGGLTRMGLHPAMAIHYAGNCSSPPASAASIYPQFFSTSRSTAFSFIFINIMARML
jgi:hypothetical protein